MNPNLHNSKVAVITGGTSGIGLEISRELLERGVRVFSLSRSGAKAECAKVLTDKFIPISADIRIEDDLSSAMETVQKYCSGIHYLINAAGIGFEKSLEDSTLNDYKEIFDTNVKGLIFATKAFTPLLVKGGVICNISSIAGIKGFKNWSLYCASKFAIEGFSKSIRHELRGLGIRVVVIRSGSVDTPFYKHIPREQREVFIPPSTIARLTVEALISDERTTVEEMLINNSVGDL